MDEHLPALEAAISDVGHWTWWTANLPDTFQVEFGGTQIWNAPSGEGQPPSGLIALRFRKPRLVYFLTLADCVAADWPDQLQRDELEPPGVGHGTFTLTSAALCGQLVGKAVAVRALVGEPGVTQLPLAGEALLGFEAGHFGLVVAAESLGVFNHHGELDAPTVLASIRKWWEYWREYWTLQIRCRMTMRARSLSRPDRTPNQMLHLTRCSPAERVGGSGSPSIHWTSASEGRFALS